MRIGIDLGGTKIEIAILESDGTLTQRKRVPAPSGNYDATIQAVAALIDSVGANKSIPVGIGMPGAVSPATGLIKNANSAWLNGKPFDRDLARALGRPVRLANDANCFTLSEAADGAGAGREVVFGVIAGTGIGGGVTANGRILTGRQAIAGEWGHNPLPWPRDDERPGPPCYCGKHGCIETFLGGPALAADHAAHGGKREDAAQIVASASADPAAQATMERYFDRFARALACVINILDPDVVVLGGGLSNLDALYTELPARIGAYVFSDACTTPIVRNKHGDSGGVRGAAWLWPETKI